MKLVTEPGNRVESLLQQWNTGQYEHLLLEDVSWADLEWLLEAVGERHLRFTYDRGSLEIMTISPEHEGFSKTMALFLQVLGEECATMLKNLGSMTIRREDIERGLEPDNCFYSQNFPKIRGKKRIDFTVDPPPDLALEVDVTNSSLKRLAVFAALGVPEVWRFEDMTLKVYVLNETGTYAVQTHSRLFPAFAPADFIPFLEQSVEEDDTAIVPKFRAWVRQQLGK